MKYLPRLLEKELLKAAKGFPAVVLTGPRRAGKTWLLHHLFPKADYRLLEDPETIARVRDDPQGFLDELRLPAVLDEIQNVPELFGFIRSRIDRRPRQTGQWLITGSQEAPLMQGVSESMAGRAAVLQLLPFSVIECAKVSPIRGGYPEVLARPRHAAQWFSSYLQTYIERDVRAITAVRDISTFRRFIALVASRHGQMLNKTDLAAPLGISVPTVSQWLGILEATQQILVIPPYFENWGKRLVKSPKIYLADSGLACHLLGIDTVTALSKSPFSGPLFEGFVAAEIVKQQVGSGKRRELYYFRDEQGLEVDFVMPARHAGLALIECKAGHTVAPSMAKSMLKLADAIRKRRPEGAGVSMTIVHQPRRTDETRLHTVAKGVKALHWEDFVHALH